MPRSTVRPATRQRVAHACRQCKASKRKCDASLPCSYCVKRGLKDECEFAGSPHDQRGSTRSRQQSRNDSLGSVSPSGGQSSQGRNAVLPTPGYSVTLEGGHHSPNIVSPDSATATSASPSMTRPHMLSRNRGEQVFVGRSASLSFLELIRETVSRCIGPSEFSEYAKRGQMLEVDPELGSDVPEDVSISTEQIQQCVNHYFLATSGLFHILTPIEVTELTEVTLDQAPDQAVLRFLIIAVGLQVCSVVNLDAAQSEKVAFARAQRMAFASMLENPSLNMVRAFILMSFYMLGACRRNAAFMYLGVAARAAHALGLHTVDSYQSLDQAQRHAHLRCWKSLISLDLIVSSILGRTSVSLPQNYSESHDVRITDNSAEQPNTVLEATYRLALIVDSIAVKSNKPDAITAEAAQSLLQALKKWSSLLPAALKPSTVPESITKSTQESLIGSLHISCFYYFAVMLVTRPFMIVHVTQSLADLYSDNTVNTVLESLHSTKDLACACLEAARYMAQTCSDALDLQILAENMCIIKAWIFAAGLVLGFHLFAHDERSEDSDQAYVSCQKVLGKLAARSPQAAQYRDILAQLSTVIMKHRHQRHRRQERRAQPLVERIMNLQSKDRDDSSSTPMNQGFSTQTLNPSGVQLSTNGNGVAYDTQLFLDGAADASAGLDSFFLPFGDWSTYDLQAPGMMPWDVL